jgi:hypothetical protein
MTRARLKSLLLIAGGVTLCLLLLSLVVTPSTSILAESGVRYVATDGVCSGETPCYSTIQDAVDAATSGDELRIAMGTYTGAGDPVVEIGKSLILRGGYTVTFASRDPSRYPTRIDGGSTHQVVLIADPSPSAPTINVNLEGLHIVRGRSANTAPPYERGGGVYVAKADHVVIQGCHIYEHADSGVLTGDVNDVQVLDSRIYSNTAFSMGGGLDLHAGQVTIENNEIYGNSVDAGGSGIYVSARGVLRENWIHHNRESGAVSLHDSDTTLINNLIVDNEEGGVGLSGGTARLLHTTLARNGPWGLNVTNSGVGAGTAYLTNTILVSHTVGVQTVRKTVDNSAHLVATLWGNITETLGAGTIETAKNMTGDPAFLNPDAGDYHLTDDSAARNRGVSTLVSTDIDGELRDPLPDLGADEKLVPGSIQQIHLPLILRGYP